MATIRLKNARKSFQSENETELLVLDDVDFVAHHQQFTCILGPSGCGKSTLLNVIAGLVDLDRGDITFSDLPADDGENRTEPSISYVFQEPRLLNWKSVKANMKFAMRGMGIPKTEWDERANEYLETVGLKEFKGQHPLYLSGGQRQRASIARALSIEPDVLLMDEPFSALDEITARNLRKDLLRISEQLDQTILFVTHNALEAAFLSDVVALITQRPAQVSYTLTNPLSHPRDLEDAELLEFENEIVTKLGVSDESAGQGPEAVD